MSTRLPPNDAWSALEYAQVQPWFAQRLERAGVPVKRTCVKEEVRFRESTATVSWTGNELPGVCEVDDEPTGPEHVEPAIYDYQIPKALAVLQPDDVVADWAARTFDPQALETLRALTRHQPDPNLPRSWNSAEDNATFVENLTKMHEESQKSERPEEEIYEP